MTISKVSVEQFQDIVSAGLPQLNGWNMKVEHLAFGEGTILLPYQDSFLRPGGTISGPTMMALGDLALYLAVLSTVGPEPMAVTTSLNTNFLHFPAAGDLRAKVRVLKAGRRLVYGDVEIFALAGDPELCVTHITGTYSVPVTNGVK